MEPDMTGLNAVSKVLCVLGAMSFLTAASAQVDQRPPAPRIESGVTPPPPAEVGTPTVVSGAVKRYLINPEGDVDGMLLADNTVVMFPPHLGTQVTASAAPGDTVRVTGSTIPGGTLRAQKIVNTRNGQTIDDRPPQLATGIPTGLPDPTLPRASRSAGLVKLEASGSVAHVTTAPRGEPDGVLLADGTIIKLTPPAASQFSGLLRPGTVIAAQGYGTRNQYGESLQATAFGTPGNLTPLYAPAPQ
jgi:hypothetical protein